MPRPALSRPPAAIQTHRLDPVVPRDASRSPLDAAIRAVDAAEQLAEPATLALALAQVGRACRALGDGASAEWYLQQGLRWALTLSSVDASVELLCDLAEVASERAEGLPTDGARLAYALRERARDHSYEAIRLAARSADARWEVTVLLRASHVLQRCGDVDDAASLQSRALSVLAGMPAVAAASGSRANAPN